jgi:hypothetical protein
MLPDDDRPGAGPGTGGDNLANVRRLGEDYLAASDEAIDRTLSRDSRAFLRANRQQGGQ